MFKLKLNTPQSLSNENKDMYYIYFNTYFIDKYKNYYEMVDDKVYNIDYEEISKGKNYVLEQVYKSNVESQLPMHYYLDSNVIIKFVKTPGIQKVYRGFMHLEKFNSSLSIQDISNLLEIKDVYYESDENIFLQEKILELLKL